MTPVPRENGNCVGTMLESRYGLAPDKFNMVRPAAALKCDAMLIRILPTVGFCSGVHEIQLEFETPSK